MVDEDGLLPINADSDVYAGMIAGGLYPTQIRPILPCYRQAFQRLTDWVTGGQEPPASQTVARPDWGDVANTCPELDGSAVHPDPS